MRWVLRNTQTGDYFAEPHGPELTEWTPYSWLAYQFVTYERASSGATVFWALHGVPLEVKAVPLNEVSQKLSGTESH